MWTKSNNSTEQQIKLVQEESNQIRTQHTHTLSLPFVVPNQSNDFFFISAVEYKSMEFDIKSIIVLPVRGVRFLLSLFFMKLNKLKWTNSIKMARGKCFSGKTHTHAQQNHKHFDLSKRNEEHFLQKKIEREKFKSQSIKDEDE